RSSPAPAATSAGDAPRAAAAVSSAQYADRDLARSQASPQNSRRTERTSSSLVGEKSSYQRPTAWNGSGVINTTSSSTSTRKSWHVERGAVGTATTIRAGSWRRSAATTASMVEPV